MREFSQTASSKLSIEEFESVDLGEEEDPPAFKVGFPGWVSGADFSMKYVLGEGDYPKI